MNERLEDGYYWVFRQSELFVAMLNSNGWLFPGDEYSHDYKDFNAVSARITSPGTVK